MHGGPTTDKNVMRTPGKPSFSICFVALERKHQSVRARLGEPGGKLRGNLPVPERQPTTRMTFPRNCMALHFQLASLHTQAIAATPFFCVVRVGASSRRLARTRANSRRSSVPPLPSSGKADDKPEGFRRSLSSRVHHGRNGKG